MSSKLGLTMLVGALALASGACVPTDVGFGETVKYAQAVQTIDPDPVYGPDAAQPGEAHVILHQRFLHAGFCQPDDQRDLEQR